VKGVPKRDCSCRRDPRLTRMCRRLELCAAPWVAAQRVGTLELSYPRACAPCLRPTGRPLVETNWTTTGRSSRKAKWKGTVYALSFKTLSARSSTGALWPSTEKRCLTNSGNSADSLGTSLTGHSAERAPRIRCRITWPTTTPRPVRPCALRVSSSCPFSPTHPSRRDVSERGRLCAHPKALCSRLVPCLVLPLLCSVPQWERELTLMWT